MDKKEIIKKVLKKRGKGGPGDLGDPTQMKSSDMFYSLPGMAANGVKPSGMGNMIDQNFGTNQNQDVIDPNPRNLPQNVKQNDIPSKPDLSPQPPDMGKQKENYLPGKSRVKPSFSGSIVKKMLSKVRSYK